MAVVQGAQRASQAPKIAAIAGAVGLVIIGVVAWATGLGPFGDAEASEPVATIDTSLTQLVGTQVPVRNAFHRGFAENLPATLPAPPRANGGRWTGDAPGLYGGAAGDGGCDRDAAAVLAAGTDTKSDAWRAAMGGEGAQLSLAELTPAVLLADVAALHTRFAEKTSVAVPAVLQKGTAVFVDATGAPRLRCQDLGPLAAAPDSLPAATEGDPWDGFDMGTVGRIQPAAAKLDVLELAAIDPASALPFLLRPVGSSGGGSDVPVPARDASGLRAVPDFRGGAGGKSSDQARAYGWKVEVEQRFDPAPNEQVIDQVPAPGTPHRAGEAITLIVSRGPKSTVPVPAVTGLALEAATAELAKVGLVAEIAEQVTVDVLENTVISSDPPGATEVKQSTKVKLLVARFPTVKVPDLIGRAGNASVTALNGIGLPTTTSEQFDDNIAVGGVVSMSPNPNEVVKVGTPVALVISRGRAIFVPDLSGQSATQARSSLASLGLSVSEDRRINETIPAGIVIAHSPGPGTPLLAGETVNLVVSDGPYTGPPIVLMPNVSGLTAEAAEAQLRALGLVVVRSQQPSTTVPAGSVIASVPGPTTQLVVGNQVEIVVSLGNVPPNSAPAG